MSGIVDLHDLRREYTKDGLSEEALLENPFQQFETWFKQAQQTIVTDPNAMQVATVSKEGKPSIRTVLLKSFDEQGFVFYTNLTSQKAKEMEANPNVSAIFFWKELERQVEIGGRAERISALDTLKYFTSRPRGSQLGAWVSAQSSIISSRQVLETKLDEMKRKFSQGEVPLPDFWGGIRIVPETIEFWQGRANRLHDRFEYQQQPDHTWAINRLAP